MRLDLASSDSARQPISRSNRHAFKSRRYSRSLDRVTRSLKTSQDASVRSGPEIQLRAAQKNLDAAIIFAPVGSLIYKCSLKESADADSTVLKAKHKASKKVQSASEFLLGLCGLDGVELLAKKKGDKWGVSFRQIAHLVIVSEEQI